MESESPTLGSWPEAMKSPTRPIEIGKIPKLMEIPVALALERIKQ